MPGSGAIIKKLSLDRQVDRHFQYNVVCAITRCRVLQEYLGREPNSILYERKVTLTHKKELVVEVKEGTES